MWGLTADRGQIEGDGGWVCDFIEGVAQGGELDRSTDLEELTFGAVDDWVIVDAAFFGDDFDDVGGGAAEVDGCVAGLIELGVGHGGAVDGIFDASIQCEEEGGLFY